MALRLPPKRALPRRERCILCCSDFPGAICAEAKPVSVPYVQSITNVLSDHLGWHRARLKLMARFRLALEKLPATNL